MEIFPYSEANVLGETNHTYSTVSGSYVFPGFQRMVVLVLFYPDSKKEGTNKFYICNLEYQPEVVMELMDQRLWDGKLTGPKYLTVGKEEYVLVYIKKLARSFSCRMASLEV